MSSVENSTTSWVVADAFVDLLKSEIPNFVKITEFEAKSALKPGENYGTNILRLTIKVELDDNSTEQLSYIMKVPQDNPMALQMLQIVDVFKIENLALKTILPELEQMYKDVGISVKFGPTLLRLPHNEENHYVLMKDLAVSGYKNVQRQNGLDIVHMERVLEFLAQYHAASAVRLAEKGEFSELTMCMEAEAIKMLYAGMISSFKAKFLANLENYKDGKKYEKSVSKFYDEMPDLFMNFYKYDPDEFNVLLHGDCWCNNIMFKHSEENEIDDLIFVDFQMPRCGSPVLDLFYLIISSAQFDIKISKFDYFIRYYHEHLIKYLRLLKYPKPLPILRELFQKTYKYGEYGFMTAVTTLAGVLVDSSDKAKLDTIMSDTPDGNDFRNMLYGNSRYNEHISELLPWFYNRGTLTDEKI